MPKKGNGQADAVVEAVVLPEQIQQELTLLRGFRDLVAERVAYAMGVQAINEEAREKTEAERTNANNARKFLRENLETFIKNADIEGYKKALEEIEKASKKLKEARKPYNDKLRPLRRAIKYIDNIAVPEALKELGVTVQPAFSLSEWIQKVLEERKRKRKK